MTRRHPGWAKLKRYFITGLLVWVPAAITFFALRLVVTFVDQSLLLIPKSYRPEERLGFGVPGLGVILTLAVLLLTGMLVSNLLGRRVLGASERQIGRIPIVGALYRGSKQLAETLLSPGSKSFRKVVLIRWPHRESWAIAFVTGSSLGEVQEKTESNLICVFLPTTPNPTSGFILMVPAADVLELEMAVDEAFRMIVSLGVVVPKWPPANGRLETKNPPC